MNNMEGTEPYIWLRHATQYEKDGHTHTIEIGIFVPIGTSAEAREQAIREAETGMGQLVSHVDARLPQMLQRALTASQPRAEESAPVSTTKPAAPQRPVNRPASTPAPQTAPQAPGGQVREARPELHNTETVVPPTRPNVGASMPLTLGPGSDASGNIPLPEFLQYIKENLGLDPKQAMNLLNVRSLSTINRREALVQLQSLVSHGAQTTGAAPSAAQKEQDGEPASPLPPQERPNTPTNGQFIPTPEPVQVSASAHGPREDMEASENNNVIEMRVNRPAKGFDEEVNPGEEDELEDFDDLDLPRDFSPQQLERAADIIRELRESQGAAVASPKRLQVLNTIAISQVSEEQLQDLAGGVWNIPTLKKLKVDQVEALISWAKQDYFVEELEAALAVLEEERYARGNR